MNRKRQKNEGTRNSEPADQVSGDVVLPLIAPVGEEKPRDGEEDAYKDIPRSEAVVVADGRQELK